MGLRCVLSLSLDDILQKQRKVTYCNLAIAQVQNLDTPCVCAGMVRERRKPYNCKQSTKLSKALDKNQEGNQKLCCVCIGEEVGAACFGSTLGLAAICHLHLWDCHLRPPTLCLHCKRKYY